MRPGDSLLDNSIGGRIISMKIRKRKTQLRSNVTESYCSVCKQILPASEFYPHRRMKNGLQSSCRKCVRKWHKERPEYVKKKNAAFKAKNPTYGRDRNRMVKFGLTPSRVEEMRIMQKGKCPGCHAELQGRNLCVDHCHKSGRVRGLLCMSCNVSIGRLGDNPETLRRLAFYLEIHQIRDSLEENS